MSEITLPTEDIVALSGDETDNILFEWISRMPIQDESLFSIHCTEKLQNYLMIRGLSNRTHRIKDILDMGYWGSEEIIKEIARGFCFAITYEQDTSDVDRWVDFNFYFYKSGYVKTQVLSTLPQDEESEVLKFYNELGFKDSITMSWTEAYNIIAKINGSSIPPVPLE
jgi:hypothetical protein